jgi:hypothetical protein
VLQANHQFVKCIDKAGAALKCFNTETPELTTAQIAERIDMRRTLENKNTLQAANSELAPEKGGDSFQQ